MLGRALVSCVFKFYSLKSQIGVLLDGDRGRIPTPNPHESSAVADVKCSFSTFWLASLAAVLAAKSL